MNANEVREFRLGELFCGPGGLALRVMTARIGDPEYKTIHKWVNNYDADTRKAYRRNICLDDEESVICGDVRKFDIEPLGDTDVLASGFPCNDFSVVGEQKGFGGTFGPLYTYGVKALKRYQPLWFLTENVGGSKSANEGRASKKIQEDLAEAGYRIYPNLYKFKEYGVPQVRRRTIIVGIRKDLPYEFKIPSTEPYKDKDISCRTVIEVPEIPVDAPNNKLTKRSPQVVERLSYIKPGQNVFTADIPEGLQLKVKGAKISQIYRRLPPDKPVYTVTDSGGGGIYIYHYEEPRALTNRERARLQIFLNNLVLEGSKESVRKQIGMAVPADGARIISEAILKTFAGIPYDSMAPYIGSGD